ncbi:MAG: hypothetical protein K5666_03395 [Bacilli bacterium]|nr:hypothetical protein [Bacilli bacterium]
MKKKIVLLLLVILGIGFVGGCNKTTHKQSSIDFKNEYEALNGKSAKGDKVYRTLNINENNPYVKVTPSEIVKKIENNETFYLYVGDPLCPWCRSGLEKAIEVAMKNGIKSIYYIDFWDDDHNEILRDLYSLEVNKKGKATITKTKDATPEYTKILEAVKNYVQDYTMEKDGKEYEVGVKRIFGGDHFYFKEGKCSKYMTLRSDKLKGSFDELTEEVLNDQTNVFTNFFNN